MARDRIYIEQLKDELKRLQLQSKLKLSDASYKERFDEVRQELAQHKEQHQLSLTIYTVYTGTICSHHS